MTWLHYLLEANLYLAVAYGCYWLLFRKQTFYTANRFYLLASTVLCFVIPLVQVSTLAPVQPIVQTVQTTATVVGATQTVVTHPANTLLLMPNKALQTIYWLVVASMCAWLVTKLYSLLKLVVTNKRLSRNNLTLVYLNDEHTPFSFFGYLFVDPSGKLDEAMLRHEMVHIRQKHSWDIMFTEVIKIVNWFNPVVYLLQNSLKALHEFEADRLAAGNHQAPDAYVDFLITQAYHSNGVPFAHQFSNKQLLKLRIMKLYQKRSGKLARLSYLMAVPLCAGLLCASSLAFSKDYGWIKIGVKKVKTSTTPVDSLAQKLRLKVTSNGMTGITDKLEIKGYPGKKMIYTAQTLTASDRKYLLRNFGIGVETTTAKATTTSLILPSPSPPPLEPSQLKSNNVPPPPPPSQVSSPSRMKPVYKGSKLPPPPPPPSVEVTKSNSSNIPPPPPPIAVRFASPKKAIKPAKAETIMFPPPRVYDESGKEVTSINGVPLMQKTTTRNKLDEVKPTKLSFIEAESIRFKNIASLIKPVSSPGC